MKTVHTIVEADESGTIHVALPVGNSRRVEVTVVWRELESDTLSGTPERRKRAELEALAGALADDPIVRPEQIPNETRAPVE